MKGTTSRLVVILLTLSAALASWSCASEEAAPDPVVVAYVTSWTDDVPDPTLMTHINYSFGHVSDSFDGVRVDNPERLHMIAGLKKENPALKLMLSIGGWGSGGFSEMAADDSLRASFASDCMRVVEEFGLDGIDIDWEYPGNGAGAGIGESPEDRDNFTLLMHDIRAAIGPDRWLTLASSCQPRYIDFPSIMDCVDLVNIMSYDMSEGDELHSALHPSELTPEWTTSRAVEEHLEAGVPKGKLVVGIPFFGKGTKAYGGGRAFSRIYPVADSLRECWDEKAMVPYLTDAEGNYLLGFENERSVDLKCGYILGKGLRGAMYWDYHDNAPDCVLSRLLASRILGISCD